MLSSRSAPQPRKIALRTSTALLVAVSLFSSPGWVSEGGQARAATPPQSSTPNVPGGPVQVGPWQIRATRVQVRAEGVTVTLALKNPNSTTQTFAVREIAGVIAVADGSRVENLKPLHEVTADIRPHQVASNQEDTMTLFFPLRNPSLRQRVSTMNIMMVRKPSNLPVGMGQIYLPAAEPEPGSSPSSDA
jgi:hypothetical protein